MSKTKYNQVFRRVRLLHPYLFDTGLAGWYLYRIRNKGVSIMKNRSFIVGLAFAGLAMQVFTLICAGALKQGYIDGFNAASVITLFTTVILTLWSQPCPKDKERDREDLYRDMDAIYRHIDDTSRDLRDEIRECGRSCGSHCKIGKK